MDNTHLILDLWEWSRRMAETTNCLIRPLAGRYGLTPMQLRLLLLLWPDRKRAAGALAREALTPVSNVSLLSRFLEEEGFVTRIRNPEDQRVCLLELSPAGRLVVMEITGQLHERISGTTGGRDPDILEAMEILSSLLNGLGDAPEDFTDGTQT